MSGSKNEATVWPCLRYKDATAAIEFLKQAFGFVDTVVVPSEGGQDVVTDSPDALFDRALAAGATEVQGLRDEDYGSRGFTVTGPEGNHWSFGTYRGE